MRKASSWGGGRLSSVFAGSMLAVAFLLGVVVPASAKRPLLVTITGPGIDRTIDRG